MSNIAENVSSMSGELRGDPRLLSAAGRTPDAAPFASFLTVVLRHRALIVATTAFAVIATAAVVLFKDRTYTSTVVFFPQARRTPSAVSGVAAQLGLALQMGSETEQSPAFYVDLVKSRGMLTTLVRERFQTPNDPPRTLTELLEARGPTPDRLEEDAIRRLGEHVTAAFSTRTGVVTVEMSATSPVLAQQVLNKLVEAVVTFNLSIRQSKAEAEAKFTQGRLAEATTELRAAEDQLQSFLQSNRGGIPTSPGLRFEETRLTRKVEQKQGLYSLLATNYEQARLEQVRDTPVITVIDPPNLPARPDRRSLLLKTMAALAGGFLLGIVLAFVRNDLAAAGRRKDTAAVELEDLRRATLYDLRHPYRTLTRAIRKSPGNGG